MSSLKWSHCVWTETFCFSQAYINSLSLSPLSLLCHSTSVSLTPVILSDSFLSSSPTNSFLSVTAVFSFILSFCSFYLPFRIPSIFFQFLFQVLSFSDFPLLNLLFSLFLYILTPCFISIYVFYLLAYRCSSLSLSLSPLLSLSHSSGVCVCSHTHTRIFLCYWQLFNWIFTLLHIFCHFCLRFPFLDVLFCFCLSVDLFPPPLSLSLSHTHTHTHAHTHTHTQLYVVWQC